MAVQIAIEQIEPEFHLFFSFGGGGSDIGSNSRLEFFFLRLLLFSQCSVQFRRATQPDNHHETRR